jgi:hypothetical protein
MSRALRYEFLLKEITLFFIEFSFFKLIIVHSDCKSIETYFDTGMVRVLDVTLLICRFPALISSDLHFFTSLFEIQIKRIDFLEFMV